MARSLVLGNGNVLIVYDEWGQVRDFYFPQVGLENHVGERLMHRIGVFVDGAMHWLSGGGFEVEVTYWSDTLVGKVHAVHREAGIDLTFSDIVYNEHDIYVRSLVVENLFPRDRTVKLFFNQQFHISEAERGDTAYYSPELQALVHYKGRRVILVSAHSDEDFFDDYGVGLLGIEGKEGTWRDAEDGVLSKSGIEHGSVDSVLGLTLHMRSKSTRSVSYWIAVGQSYRVVERHHRDILTRGPAHLLRTTSDYWKAWVDRPGKLPEGIDAELAALCCRSLLVMRTHTDNGGAVVASGDSSILQSGRDTYSYCWPRDSAYVVLAFLEMGHISVSHSFHKFVQEILTDDGYLLHKYRTDRSLGSSWHPWVREGHAQPPIQEDETAITLITLGRHYELTHDVEFIEEMYNPYIRRVADFLARYRDKKTKLPLPSHDLWEEHVGAFTYTSSVVYAALSIAASFAKLLGKEVSRKRWASAAEEMREGILRELVSKDGRAAKRLAFSHGESSLDETIDVSSFYGLFRFGVLSPYDPVLERIYERTCAALTTDVEGVGVSRYDGDRYFAHQDAASNPWVVTTCWIAEYEIARAKDVQDLEMPRRRLEWIKQRANVAGLFAEQYHPRTHMPTSVTPLIWSHAQYILTFLAYSKKYAEFRKK
ncbi:MAG: glycoside hydrolase family 15 protein [Candidatus Pacebacteria bacterium]|nr:glycoside hydrolase family 15 protein [Candidatus Paceibacterota bacterium]